MAHRDRRDRLVQPDLKVYKELPEQQVLPALRDNKAYKAYRVNKGSRG